MQMRKSHDQPLCAYLLRYEADIQPGRCFSTNDIYIPFRFKSDEKKFKLSSRHQTIASKHPV